MVYQIASLIGAILILIAFTAQQLKKITSETYAYLVLNLVGGVGLFIGAVGSVNYGFILLEGFWVLVSGFGVWQLSRRRRVIG